MMCPISWACRAKPTPRIRWTDANPWGPRGAEANFRGPRQIASLQQSAAVEHIASPQQFVAVALRRRREPALEIGHRIIDSGQRFIDVRCCVGGAEPVVPGNKFSIVVEVYAVVKGGANKACREYLVLPYRVRIVRDRLGPAEVDAETGAETLRVRGEAVAPKDVVELGIETARQSLDPIVESGAPHLAQCREPCEDGEQVAGVCSTVRRLAHGCETVHDPRPPGQNGDGNAVGDGLPNAA